MDIQSLQSLWEDSGFASINAFWRFLQENYKNQYKRADVDEFIKSQASKQVLKRFKRPTHESSIWAPRNRDQYQMDIMVYNRYAYQGYQYILGCVDVHSRFVACRPLTSREQLNDGSVFKAFKSIMEEMGNPRQLDCDNEFATAPIQQYCKQHDIFLNLSYADSAIDNKNALIESFWRGLAQRLMVRRRQGYVNWPKDLPLVIKQYNNSYQNTIKQKPVDVWANKAENLQDVTKVPKVFKVGDLVRKLLKLSGFAKGDAQGYSDDIYRIIGHDPSKAQRWLIENIKTGEKEPRGYTENELQLIPHLVIKPEGYRAKVAAKAQTVEQERPTQLKLEREQRRLQTDTVEGQRQQPTRSTRSTRLSSLRK